MPIGLEARYFYLPRFLSSPFLPFFAVTQHALSPSVRFCFSLSLSPSLPLSLRFEVLGPRLSLGLGPRLSLSLSLRLSLSLSLSRSLSPRPSLSLRPRLSLSPSPSLSPSLS